MTKDRNKLTFIALFLILIMFTLIVYFAAIGYPNVLSIVVPIAIFIGFWIWQLQEQMKRRADSAEILIRKYDTYENELLAVWKIANIKHYDMYADTDDMKEFRRMINSIISKVEKCQEAKVELDSSIKIFVRRKNINYTYKDIAEFINEFSQLTYFLSLVNKIEPLDEDKKNFQNIARQFDNIDSFLRTTNFGTDTNVDCIFDKPRKAIEKNTNDVFNLLVL
jgi:cbb3-type cytochrome oxidase subunit 3